MTIPRQTSHPAPSDAAAIRAFQVRLKNAARKIHFMFGREMAAFTAELRYALYELGESVSEPRSGVKAVARFFRSDKTFFNKGDDSDGNLGQVFTIDARDLFAHYAEACVDKKWLVDLVLRLQRDDDYGVRDCLVDAASQYLPSSVIRGIIEQLWMMVRDEPEKHHQSHWLYLIESLARQIRDPEMFKRASRAAWPQGSVAQCMDIAEVYLESNNAKTALTWLSKVPLDEQYQAGRRDKLLLSVYQRLGKKEEAVETAWRIFRRSRHEETFEQLMEVTGSTDRQRLLDDEAKLILKASEFSYTDADFLLWCGKVEDAETYLFSHIAEINGDFYYSVLPLAEAMESEERYLAATVLYRALLESILGRAISKNYGHGVRYLRKLEELAPLVQHWQSFTPHQVYFSNLVEKHKRKSSFWARYEAKRGGRRKNQRNSGIDNHDLG